VFVKNVKMCYLFHLSRSSYLTCSVYLLWRCKLYFSPGSFCHLVFITEIEGFKFSHNPSVLWRGYWIGFCSEGKRRTKAKNSAFLDVTPCSLVAWCQRFRGGSKCVPSKLGRGLASHKAVDLYHESVRCSRGWDTGMRRITTFRTTTDRIYDGGPIRF